MILVELEKRYTYAKQEINVIDHLDELRTRIIYTMISFLAFLILSFIFVKDIHDFLVKDLDQSFAVLGCADILWVYMMIATVVSLSCTFHLPLTKYGALSNLV